MGNGIFGIGLSGLNAAQQGLLVSGHNVANAATPGYSRQQIVQTSSGAQATGNGYVGQGVQVDTVRRVYNELLVTQVMQAKTESVQLDTYLSQMKQIDSLLADPSGRLGLAPALQDFFGSVQDVATDPSGVASRQSMLSNAEVLARRFQSLNERLDSIQGEVNSGIENSISLVNTLAKKIGELNGSISLAENMAGQPANDLRDQRDELVMQLNQEVRAKVVEQKDGSYNIYIGTGQTLVAGETSFSLAAVPSSTDSRHLDVVYVSEGNKVALKESSLDGGRLGGLLQFRSSELDAVRNGLGRLAIGLASSFNDQHLLGQDMLGNPGSTFFTVPDPLIAASARNGGNATITGSIQDYKALSASDYRLRYDGANYTLTRLSDGNAQTFATFPQTVDGVRLELALGTAAATGDEFLIRPTVNGAGQIEVAIKDTSLIAAAAPIRTDAPLANTGTGRISAGAVNAPPPPDPNLGQPVTITFTSATTFDVSGIGTGSPAGVTFTPGGAISFNGWTVQITGAPQPGDTFTIGPNTNGAADNRNALLLGMLQSGNTLAGGTTTYLGAYNQVVSLAGNKTRELEVTSAAQTALLRQAQALQQSESGVNLDEEAANLLRYQQAYQAASKVIQTANQMFEALLDIAR